MDKQLLYIYDLPKSLATSVTIAKAIKDQSGYELQEPVQFKECRPLPNGLESPFQYGIIKIDTNQLPTIANAIKYFELPDGDKTWKCRSLPFDKELLGANKLNTNSTLNVFVKKLDAETSAKELDAKFQEAFGPVKSAKVSMSVKTDKNAQSPSLVATSNGYGFVCFQNQDAHDKAVTAGKLGEFEIIRYQPKDPREFRKTFNNIYVKNFNPSWDEAKIREVFSRYGDIKSVALRSKAGKDGVEKPFAFVCYERAADKAYGPECANKAVTDLNDKELDGYKIYVQPAVPAPLRQAQVKHEQFRFKNSKKKCNLFVKNFPSSFNEEKLREIFGQYGEIESIMIINKDEAVTEGGSPNRAGGRAFVCFKQPDQAMTARSHLHNYNIDGKQLYVVNYELPEIRRKQQIDAKDKADFMNSRKNSAPIDPSLFNRPETLQLIQQILFLYQRQMGFNNRNNFQRGDGSAPQANRGPRQPRYNSSAPQQRNQSQRAPMQQPMQPAMQQAPAPVGGAGVDLVGTTMQYLAHPDPAINFYNQNGFSMLPGVVPHNPNLKNFVGEFIYSYVEKLVGEQMAPKITGMLIDLPIEEIKAYLYSYEKLCQKVFEANNILQSMMQQQPTTQQ